MVYYRAVNLNFRISYISGKKERKNEKKKKERKETDFLKNLWR